MKEHIITLRVIEYEPGDEREPVAAKLLTKGSFSFAGNEVPCAIAATPTAILVRGADHVFVLDFSEHAQALLDGISPPVPPPPAPVVNKDEYHCLGDLLRDTRVWNAILKKYGVTDAEIREELGIKSRSWKGHEHIEKQLVQEACEKARDLKANRRAVALAGVRTAIVEAMNSLENKGLEDVPDDALLESWIDPYVGLKGATIESLTTTDLMALEIEIRALFADAEDLFELADKEERHG